MSTAPATVLDQAQRLVKTARLLPADDAAKALEQAVTVLQAAQAEILVEAERSGDLQDSGCATVRSFAATILRRSVNDAAELSQVAHHLAAFPKLAAAYAAGQIHTPNLRTILRHRKACGLAALQAHEDLLVPLATQAGPKELAALCQHIADLNKPDRDEAKAKALGLRSVRIAKVGDLAHLDAMLDPVVADQLKATLAAMTKAARAAEKAAAKAAAKQAAQTTKAAAEKKAAAGDGDDDSHGDGHGFGDDGDAPASDPRTHGERCADALEELLRRGMNGTDLPTQGRHRPHTTLHLDVKDLLGLPGHGQPLLARFGPISTATAARVACDSTLRLLITHGRKVLYAGRRQRLVNDAQHAALAATHPTCVLPGCHIKFGDCDIHHLWWWSQQGLTDLDLQVPVCASHHIWLHEGGYSITREDGTLVFRDRKGRLVTNTTDLLHQQLDLLHQRHHPHDTDHPGRHRADSARTADPGWNSVPADPASPADSRDPPDRHDDEIDQALADLDEWASTPYDHGTWGWNGHNPSPPPGHAPPQ